MNIVAKSDARPAGALDRTGGLVQFVGKCSCKMAPFTREGTAGLLAWRVLVFDPKELRFIVLYDMPASN